MESNHALPTHRPTRAASSRLLGLALLGAVAAAGGAISCGPTQPGPQDPPADQPGPASGGDTVDAVAVEIEADGLSVDARVDTWEMLVADLEAPRHPSDGGGRAWLDMDPAPRVPAATPARLVVVFEAGPLGVMEGGLIFLQPSPFWDWDPPQIRQPGAPGYTTVRTDAPGIELVPDDATGAFLAVEIRGRALRPGERLTFVYGDGDVGARVDRFAEERSPLYVAVDGDGDGVRAVVEDGPRVDVVPHGPRRLNLVAASTASPGTPVRLTIAALDALGNPSADLQGGVVFDDAPAGTNLPGVIDLSGDAHGHRTLLVTGLVAGTHRLEIHGTGDLDGLTAVSNPIVIREGIERVLWGDLHGHSQISDGTGTPDQYYRYARDVAGLDVSALTDHDHWGMVSLDADPAAWTSIHESVARHHEPGRFVALLGYEWTSWLHGHRHVLWFDTDHGDGDEKILLSSLDPRYQTPAQLWDALRGQDVLTFAHHSAGGPVSTNWRDYPPDPVLEPVTEIVSVHGSSEAADSPKPIYDPVPGNYVRDAVGAGYVLGFIGSGDSHDGHPGLVQVADPGGAGGLAALRSETLTRAGVRDAMQARRVYATDGARIWLDVRLDDRPMGTVFEADDDGTATQKLEVEIAGTAPIERIDLIRSGHTASIDLESERPEQAARDGHDETGELDVSLAREIPRLMPGEYHYVRVVQRDGHAAWSSPIYASRRADSGSSAKK